MTTDRQLTAGAGGGLGESLTRAQKEALECAVAKIVAFGAQELGADDPDVAVGLDGRRTVAVCGQPDRRSCLMQACFEVLTFQIFTINQRRLSER